MNRIMSMTGFGSNESYEKKTGFKVYIKAVNRKGLDLQVHLPHIVRECEHWIREDIVARIQRGSVHVNVEFELSQESHLPNINLQAWQRLVEKATEACRSARLSSETMMPYLLSSWSSTFGVFSSTISSEEIEDRKNNLRLAFEQALEDFESFRSHEGDRLKAILGAIINDVNRYVAQLCQRALQLVGQHVQKLKNRLEQLGVQLEQDSARWCLEVSLLADKSDIQEELDRLQLHLNHFALCLDQGPFPIGKKLDFLSQEMLREMNTLINKAQDFEMSQIGIEVKVGLERLREQIQNLE